MARLISLMALLVALTTPPARALLPGLPQSSDAALLGLWGAETWPGPQVRGDLLLELTDHRWCVRVGGFEVSAPSDTRAVHLVLPGGQGEVRVFADEAASSPRAFWVQPRGALSAFASPVELRPAGPHAWRGEVVPLDEQFSLYLSVARGDDGLLRGIFRNPEVNWHGGAPWFRVGRRGDDVIFVDPRTGKERFVQPFDEGQRRIQFDFGEPLALTPRTPDQAVGLFPRSPLPSTAYRCRPPLPAGDGWRVGHAIDVGLDASRLQAAVEHLILVNPTDEGTCASTRSWWRAGARSCSRSTSSGS